MIILRYLIYSNLLVSISAGLLAGACATELGSPHNIGIGITVFFATIFIYNIQRLLRFSEVKKSFSIRHQWMLDHFSLLKVLTIIGIVGSIATYFLLLGWEYDFWFLAFSAIFGVMYAYHILPKSIALRDVPYIKIYMIAIQWTLVGVYWPYMRIADQIAFPLVLGLAVFCLILAITIPFDIRDLVYDNPKQQTIPQVMGKKGAKMVGLLILVASAILLSIYNEDVLLSPWYYACYLGFALLIAFAKESRKEMYFSGLIDGWIITFALILLNL